MSNRKGQTAPSATESRTSAPVRPSFPSLAKLPETSAELFDALAMTVETTIQQPDPTGGGAQTQRYVSPWPGFTSWNDARKRLAHFEAKNSGKFAWVPFNNTESNDGPMSLNAYPGRAFIERVTNCGDANLELKATTDSGPRPASPHEAVARWYGLGEGDLATAEDSVALSVAQKTVAVRAFVGKDEKDCILDARDFGIGLSASEMPDTILSLNRGNKKSKPYLTGKHGQGASSTYQYSDLTLIASRKHGTNKVAFTLVEGAWDEGAKTPTYKYLTVGGSIPEIDAPSDFAHGTLVRHIGYTAQDLGSLIGENSLYGLLMRSLAQPLFPVWLEVIDLHEEAKAKKVPVFAGFRRFGRTIRGTVNALERSWQRTLRKQGQDDDGGEILHRASEVYTLPEMDMGARVGVIALGSVRFNYWVAEPRGRSAEQVMRNWVDPSKTILMTLDGQTHAEESKGIVTGSRGAKLWAAGKYMVVQIDCDGLDPRAKYDLFTSTREHAKETPIKRLILDELIRRLSFDTRLQELNVKLAAADITQTDDDQKEAFASLIKKYLSAVGISFDQMTRKVEKWVDAEEERKAPVPRPPLPPIESVEPPTFVRWRFKGEKLTLYPGQKHSAVFETDAAPIYWDPINQAGSKIKVTAIGARYVGAGEMLGGRVRCHFECPEDAAIGSNGLLQVQLDYAPGQSKNHVLPVEVVAKPERTPRDKPEPKDEPTDPSSPTQKVIKVKVRKRDFTEVEIPVIQPVPVRHEDTTWNTLSWPHDPDRVGFSIRQVSGAVKLYYNAEFRPFLEMKRRMSKKSLEEEFIRRYEMKLVLHTIFSLNYDFVDEDDYNEEDKKRLRNVLCATAESLALATKAELEIEAKIKSEDSGALDAVLTSAAGA